MGLPPLNPGLFNLAADHLWVSHCSQGPVPAASVRAIQDWLGRELRPWKVRWNEDAVGLPAAVRKACAQVIGAEAEDITLTPTTSSGLGAVAHGYPWRSGDEVLAPLGEFPSNIWPWKALAARGVSFREVPLWEGHRAGAQALASTPPPPSVDPEAAILKALGIRTRVVALSWVRFQDGLKLDLGRLGAQLQDRGIHLVVDGIQGAGTALPDLAGVSAFATGGHKGLLAPQGQGFLWTAPTFRTTLAPQGTWLSVEACDDWSRPSTDHERNWVPDGRRLEPGVPNLLACTALLASLQTLLEPGIPAIQAHVRSLQEAFLADLSALPDWKEEADRLGVLLANDRLGPFLALHPGERGPASLQSLLDDGVERGLDATVREGYLRIAFHGWHHEADLARLRAWLSGTAN